jgi:hypothetical protein
MPKYRVEIEYTMIYPVHFNEVIEADDEDAAIEKAEDMVSMNDEDYFGEGFSTEEGQHTLRVQPYKAIAWEVK